MGMARISGKWQHSAGGYRQLTLPGVCCADGLQVAAVAQTAQRDALYCLSSSADGSLLVAGGKLCLMPLSTVKCPDGVNCHIACT